MGDRRTPLRMKVLFSIAKAGAILSGYASASKDFK
jgi:hypothetical protein